MGSGASVSSFAPQKKTRLLWKKPGLFEYYEMWERAVACSYLLEIRYPSESWNAEWRAFFRSPLKYVLLSLFTKSLKAPV